MLLRNNGFEGRDPSVVYRAGVFYHCFTCRSTAIFIAASDDPARLVDTEPICVYTPEPDREYSKDIWAPELHVIDGVCYIYFAADNGENKAHRMYVLTNDSDDPKKPYRLIGKLTDRTDRWAIDGTVFRYRGELYFVWSGWEGDANISQNLYIAKMASPTEICSERVMISTPEHEWEKRDCIGEGNGYPFINEGPFAYERDGELLLLYSASGSWANNYCLGILRLVGDDPLDASSWEKQPYPAMSREDGYNGPGHCSVTSDGKDDYIAYHVYNDGETAGWQNVHAEISRFEIKNGKIILK